jgi:hypothetical protein
MLQQELSWGGPQRPNLAVVCYYGKLLAVLWKEKDDVPTFAVLYHGSPGVRSGRNGGARRTSNARQGPDACLMPFEVVRPKPRWDATMRISGAGDKEHTKKYRSSQDVDVPFQVFRIHFWKTSQA